MFRLKKAKFILFFVLILVFFVILLFHYNSLNNIDLIVKNYNIKRVMDYIPKFYNG